MVVEMVENRRFVSACGMVQVVEERHGGTVNKFLGDGFVLFGVGGTLDVHADAAIAAGLERVGCSCRVYDLATRADRALAIGIGIHTRHCW